MVGLLKTIFFFVNQSLKVKSEIFAFLENEKDGLIPPPLNRKTTWLVILALDVWNSPMQIEIMTAIISYIILKLSGCKV